MSLLKPRGVIAIAWLLLGLCTAAAQSPGSTPSSDTLKTAKENVPIKGIIFLNEAGNPVLRPAMTLEEFERDSATDQSGGRYGFESLEITGTVEGERAELDVKIDLSIETAGELTIPLGMNNFHRIAAPEVTGARKHNVTAADDGSGYQLNISCDAPTQVSLRMKMSSKVQTGTLSNIDFQLPDVSSRVELFVDDQETVAEVAGRGDETIRTLPNGKTSSRLLLESSGGSFSVMWRKPRQTPIQTSSLEVESEMVVRWDSPADSPSIQIRLAARNAKGSINAFRIRLPKQAVLDAGSPTLGTGGQAVEFKQLVTDDKTGNLWEINIPEEEQNSRVDLNFEYQLTGNSFSAQSPLNLRVPEIVGALRHKGRIRVQIGDDYRLRWRTSPWVRGEASEVLSEPATIRQYPFRFDREQFVLPLWLSTKKRQLRITSQAELTLVDSQALIDIQITVTGPAIDGQLKMKDAGWQIQSIQQSGTDEELPHYLSESLEYRMVELNSLNDSGSSIRVLGRLSLDKETGEVQFPIPQVLSSGEDVVVRDATLTFLGSGSSLLVIDLDASKGLSRISTDTSPESAQNVASRFRLTSSDSPLIIAGTVVKQPPRITVSLGGKIEMDGDEIETTIDWEVTSSTDLGGRLPVVIPKVELPSSQTTNETANRSPAPLVTDREQWTVTVDGFPATLQARESGNIELVSDRLAKGKSIVQWRHRQAQQINAAGESSTVWISLPRPAIADATLSGTFDLLLAGTPKLQWVPVDYQRASASDFNTVTLQLETIPHDPLRLRLQPKLNPRDNQTVQHAVLRTAVSEKTGFEQLLISIQGGDTFQVQLPLLGRPNTADADLTVKAFIDGTSVNVLGRNDTLIVELPSDGKSHQLDLRVWIPRQRLGSIDTIKPLMKLPYGIGRVFWQVTTPSNAHVIWASPSIGREMVWRFSLWNVYRQPILTDEMLMRSAPTASSLVLQGNQYLYVGSDLASFRVLVFSRAILWLLVGTIILALGAVLSYFPQLRHPITGVFVAVAFAGLLVIAPDAAVLFGQVGLICTALLIAMFAIHTMLQPQRPGRILDSRSPSKTLPPNALLLPAPEQGGEAEIPETHSLKPSSRAVAEGHQTTESSTTRPSNGGALSAAIAQDESVHRPASASDTSGSGQR